MARKIENRCKSNEITSSFIDEVKIFCGAELKPHFSQEENDLLPVLLRYDEKTLVTRTLREHEQMMELAAHLEQKSALQQLSRLLKQHVRFEEKILFDVIQEKFSDVELDSIYSKELSTDNP